MSIHRHLRCNIGTQVFSIQHATSGLGGLVFHYVSLWYTMVLAQHYHWIRGRLGRCVLVAALVLIHAQLKSLWWGLPHQILRLSTGMDTTWHDHHASLQWYDWNEGQNHGFPHENDQVWECFHGIPNFWKPSCVLNTFFFFKHLNSHTQIPTGDNKRSFYVFLRVNFCSGLTTAGVSPRSRQIICRPCRRTQIRNRLWRSLNLWR